MKTKIKFEDYKTKDDIENENEDDLPQTSILRRHIHPLKPSYDEEQRPHFRIVKCCLNCKYHFTSGPNPSRMACTFPHTKVEKKQILRWPKGKKMDKEFLLMLTPTHAMCCCNSHQFKGGDGMGLGRVTRYCGAEYYGEDY